jgi:hypothetical protein
MPRCLLWKRVPGCTIPMVPMHLPPMAPMNLVTQIRALRATAGQEAQEAAPQCHYMMQPLVELDGGCMVC